MATLESHILLAFTLINLGLATAAQLRAIFQAHDPALDDAALDAILDEVTRRLARRG
jgi:hypothetical protein